MYVLLYVLLYVCITYTYILLYVQIYLYINKHDIKTIFNYFYIDLPCAN